MLGEANFHSPEEKADLAKHAPTHDETDMGNPEEKREVEIARRMKTLAHQVAAYTPTARAEGRAISREIEELADELLQMHQSGGERPKALSMLANGGGGYSDTRALTTMSMMALPQSQSYASSP